MTTTAIAMPQREVARQNRVNNRPFAERPKAVEIPAEDILLSLRDENERLSPIAERENTVYFPPIGDQKVLGITMEQLHASSDLTDRDGNLRHGINAYNLIMQVGQIAQEYHAEVVVKDLFVADNKSKDAGNGIAINRQLMTAYQKQTGTENIPFAATTFQRVFCNLELVGEHTETHCANVVVTTSQDGLQVAVGAHCYACRNQTVLGGQHFVSSYGAWGDFGSRRRGQQMDKDEFIERVRLMLRGYSFHDDMRVLAQMQQTRVDGSTITNVIGELAQIRIAMDSRIPTVRGLVRNEDGTMPPIYPLNSSQINRFAESLMLTMARKGQDWLTVYDLYQSATALYKVSTMDMPNVLPQNAAMVDFLSDRFNLEID